MKYKFTVNKTKLYKLLRENWPGWYPVPRFSSCCFEHLGSRAFWLRSAALEVYFSVVAGKALLVIDDPCCGRCTVDFSVPDLLDRFMIKAVA